MVLVASACGSDEEAVADEPVEMIDIWVVGSIQVGGTFWDQIEAGAKAAGEMIADAKLTYIAPEEYSYPNIDAMIQTAVAANPDAVLVDYRSSDFEGPVVNALNKGIEVQFFNNYVGTDSADSRVRRLSATAVGLDKAAASKRSATLYTEFVRPGASLRFRTHTLRSSPTLAGVKTTLTSSTFQVLTPLRTLRRSRLILPPIRT